MYVYIYVCAYFFCMDICIYCNFFLNIIYIYTYIRIYIYIYIYLHTYIHTYTHIYIFICMVHMSFIYKLVLCCISEFEEKEYGLPFWSGKCEVCYSVDSKPLQFQLLSM